MSVSKKILIFGAIFFLIVGTIVFLWYLFFKADDKLYISIGAGEAGSEPYLFAKAIQKVATLHYPDIDIKVVQTRGSKDSLDQIEEGKIDLAISQENIKVGSAATMVAILYSDFFHLIVRKNSGIKSFADISGKKIALPVKGSGQWVSFWFIASHYNISIDDFQNFPHFATDYADALKDGEIDGVFIARTPMNNNVKKILKESNSTIIPIDQAPAITLKQPVLREDVLLKGIYFGSPAIPPEDIQTISVNRLLVAHENTDKKAVFLITKVLFERQQELLKETPLAGMISQPNTSKGLSMPMHEGATQYYHKDDPSFLEENAEFVGLLITIALLAWSGLSGLKKYFSASQKNLADQYSKELMNILDEINSNNDPNFIQKKKIYVENMLKEVLDELDKDHVTIEGFQFFSFVWDKVYGAINDKQKSIQSIKNSI